MPFPDADAHLQHTGFSSVRFASDPSPVVIGPPGSIHGLTVHQIESVARGSARVVLAPDTLRLIERGRALLESVLGDGQPHYGINTGFGSFAQRRIPDDQLTELQRNLIRSHAAGVGRPLPTETVRAMLLLLVCSLSRGHSGVRPQTVTALADLLNARITPIVPETGSCGASGDLAPLAHAILVLIGEGAAELHGQVLSGAEALEHAQLAPIALAAKEGLALINGTHLMAAHGALASQEFSRLFSAALAAAAMSIDACRATDAFLDPRLHEARRQPGQVAVAKRLRAALVGSQILPSHALNDPRVQDPYSLRCAPQVLGAVLDAFAYVRAAVERELGAVTDNPLVFPGTGGAAADVVSGGNFHGMPLAIPLDTLAVAACHTAGIAERRIYHMLSGFDPEAKLPHFLAPQPGLHSGLMIAQYTAAAACNELIGLSTPSSVANLSTSAGMEDYNSWGARAGAKARRALELATSVVAIELLCACEAIEHHRPLRSGDAIERVHAAVRARVPRLTEDRPPAPDIAAIEDLIRLGALPEV